MCGFVVSIVSDKANLNNQVGSDTLLRGIDSYNSEIIFSDNRYFHFEFSHLFITSPETIQPIQSMSKVLLLNGEVYNYQELAERLGVNSAKFNDVSVFFQHVERYGLQITLSLTNGMYSGILFDKVTGDCEVFTDHVGKKPLLVWNSSAGWHVGTGIDLTYVDVNTTELNVVSPGMSKLDIRTGALNKEYEYQYTVNKESRLVDVIEDAILLRVPKNNLFAVALSGGLDSSIIAYVLETKLCKRARYYVVGESYPDSVLELLESLDICNSRVTLIKPPQKNKLLKLITQTCHTAKSFNPSIISNGLASLLLSKAVQKDGIRVMLSGEGADEFFCGYQAMYNGQNDSVQMRKELVRDLHFTELRRLDLISASCSVEARCPFLDYRVTNIAMASDVKELCDVSKNIGKIKLRNAFKNLIPTSIINAPKEPFDITSGLQKLVIDELHGISKYERIALKSIWEQIMKDSSIKNHHYFSHYPAFDKMIDRRERKYKEVTLS